MARARAPFAAWLREQRLSRQWRPEDIAERIDVSAATVRAWEARGSISADNRDRLERLFGVTAPSETQAPDLGALLIEQRETNRLLREVIRLLDSRQAPVVDLPAEGWEMLRQAGLLPVPGSTAGGSSHASEHDPARPEESPSARPHPAGSGRGR